MAKKREFSWTFANWRELATLIAALPEDVKNQPVMFGDVRGDNERDAFAVNEIGTVNDKNLYINQSSQQEEDYVKPGTVMLFT